MDIEYAIAEAGARWHLQFKRKSATEASAPCPFCHDGEDRFLVFDRGNYWCRQCGKTGWLDADNNRPLTPQELNEIRLRRLERQQEELVHRMNALERMHRCTDHIEYHRALDDDDRAYWHSQGIFDDAIDHYLLGICYACPTDRDHRPSYTIPIINHGKLVNIRHRLIDAPNGDKYRPHMPGLGHTLFNADNLYKPRQNTVMIVEGEKKSIVLDQYGFNTVGLMGMRSFPAAWAKRFERFDLVYVALDPDATSESYKLAELFNRRGRIVRLPVKPDDFFIRGGTPIEFREFMQWTKGARKQ